MRGRKRTLLKASVDAICLFCQSCEQNEETLGKMLHKSGLTLHYFCMLFSSGLCQRGKREEDGILGFLPADIRRERKRGMRLSCQYCKKKGATIGCVVANCRKTFHFPCGRDAGAMCQFFDEFRSYCPEHRPRQSAGSGASDRLAFYGTALSTCSICMMAVEARASNGTIRSPCCKSAWFHRDCMQKYAMSAGRYFFKCPLCNNKELFQAEMLQFGIYVPEQDAAWEREPNAYQELLERYSHCDAPKCVCPQGRQHDGMAGGQWELILCSWCGSSGSHMGCNGFTRIRKDNVCNFCAKINNSKLMERRHLNQQQSNGIARRRGRPPARRGRGRGGRVAVGSGIKSTSPEESGLKLLDVVLHRIDNDQLLQSVKKSNDGDEDVNVEDSDDNLSLTKDSCSSEEQSVQEQSNVDATSDNDTDNCQLVRKSGDGENPTCRGGSSSGIPSLPCVTIGSGDAHATSDNDTDDCQLGRKSGDGESPTCRGGSSSGIPSLPCVTIGSGDAHATSDNDTDDCQLGRKSGDGENPTCRGGSSNGIPSLPCVTIGSGDAHENAGQASVPQVKRPVGRPRKPPPVGGESSSANFKVKRPRGRPRKLVFCEQNITQLSSPSIICDRDDKHLSSTGEAHLESGGSASHCHIFANLAKGKVLHSGEMTNQGSEPRGYNKQREVNRCLENKLTSFDIKTAPADDPASDIADGACYTPIDILDVAERLTAYQQLIASKSQSQEVGRCSDILAQPVETATFSLVPQSANSLSFQSVDSEQTSFFGLVDFSSGNLRPTQNTHLTSSPDFCSHPGTEFCVSSVVGAQYIGSSCMIKPEISVNFASSSKHETLPGFFKPLSSSLQTPLCSASFQVKSPSPVSSQISFFSQGVNSASSSQIVTPELECFSSTLLKPSCSLPSGLFENPHNLMTDIIAPVVSSTASQMIETSEASMEDAWENNSPQVAWSVTSDRPVPVSLFSHDCPPTPANPMTSVAQSDLQTVTSSLRRSRPYMASNIYTPVSPHAEKEYVLPRSRGKIWLGSVQVINQLSKSSHVVVVDSDSDVEDISHSIQQSTKAVLAREQTQQPEQSFCSRQFSPCNEWKKKCVVPPKSCVIPSVPPRRTATSTSVSAATFLTTTTTAVPMATSASYTSALVGPRPQLYGISKENFSTSRRGAVVREPILACRKHASSSVIDLTTDDWEPAATQRQCKSLVLVVDSSDSEVEFLESG